MNWLILQWYKLTFTVLCRWLPRLQGKQRHKAVLVTALLPGKPGWVIPIIYKREIK